MSTEFGPLDPLLIAKICLKCQKIQIVLLTKNTLYTSQHLEMQIGMLERVDFDLAINVEHVGN